MRNFSFTENVTDVHLNFRLLNKIPNSESFLNVLNFFETI
ncbi:hypothetical protein C723_2377 [Christiangramia flava JLT2011]|uniref:Uncharacterized protein n=1 Tax=Christiangramia flava JLT2011 TaxID=1229726 RepID=A0A1L7I068_9FLAO|nr:hypothetical protein GRFL_0263 [Christiangramia flava JLT2011]OSS38659.1 hypothetical protein C723_2377 [Christiangramia flava JLT2011]